MLVFRSQFRNVTKIKTIGATFMAASGLNPKLRRENPHPFTHLFELIDFALAMQKVIEDFNSNLLEFKFILRIGYAHGDITAGVIGELFNGLRQQRLNREQLMVEFVDSNEMNARFHGQSFYGDESYFTGTTKLYYDIWGDAVNTGSRMDSYGVPGRIQVSYPVILYGSGVSSFCKIHSK